MSPAAAVAFPAAEEGASPEADSPVAEEADSPAVAADASDVLEYRGIFV